MTNQKSVSFKDRCSEYARMGRALPSHLQVWTHSSGTGEIHVAAGGSYKVVCRFTSEHATLDHVPAFSSKTSAWKQTAFLPRDVRFFKNGKVSNG